MPEMTFHPDLAGTARFLPRRVVGRRSLPVVRALGRLTSRDALPAGVRRHSLPSGGAVRLFKPATADTTAGLLWMHGGGYVMGSASQDDSLCARYVRRLGITVASVEYRLAPEHPYPAGLEDCYEALLWLARQPSVDPGRLIIGGASAGGGLAAALAFLARDRGDIDVLRQLLVYPMIDDRSSDRQVPHASKFRLWNQQSNRFGWDSYLGRAVREDAVPARRSDLCGLPPAWLGVGSLDLFYHEDLAYADRLREAGVPVDVEVITGAFHGFDSVAPKSTVARSFFDSQCRYLTGVLDGE